MSDLEDNYLTPKNRTNSINIDFSTGSARRSLLKLHSTKNIHSFKDVTNDTNDS